MEVNTQSKLHTTQAFFATRAAGWDARFTGDEPRYEQAVQDLAPNDGATVLDLGCGTGRALAPLRTAVGSTGQVIGLDVTWEMLTAAQHAGRGELELEPLLKATGWRLLSVDDGEERYFALAERS